MRLNTRTRVTATIVAVAMLAATLTACITSGNKEIREWLDRQPLVSGMEETGGYAGFTYLPNFTVTLKRDAGESGIRQFAHEIGALLAAKDAGKNASVVVGQGGLQFSVSRVRESTEAIVSDWFALRADSRITGGHVSDGEALVKTEQELMTAVYRDHFSPQRRLETFSEKARFGALEWTLGTETCPLSEAGDSPSIDLAEKLLAHTVFEHQSLQLCGGFALLVGDIQQMPATAEDLRLLLASAPPEVPPVTLSVAGSISTGDLLITGASAAELSVITGLLGTSGISALGRNDSGIMAEVRDTATMTNLLSTLSQHPDSAALTGVTVRYASNGSNVRDSIGSASVAGAIAQLETIHEVLAAAGGLGWTHSSDTEFRYFLAEDDYTPERAESVASAVHARGLGATHKLTFGLPLPSVSVEVVENRVTQIKAPRSDLRPRGEHLSAYWGSLNG